MESKNNLSDIIKQIKKNRENMIETLQPAIYSMEDIRKRLSESTSPLTEMIQAFQLNMEKLGLDINKRIQEASDDVEKCKAILLEYGFPPHYDMNIKQMRKIAHHYTENGKESTHQLLDEFFVKFFSEDRINFYLEKWLKIDWLEERHTILNEAILAHKKGLYYASISTLLPQIEGVIFTHDNFVGRTNTYKLKAALKRLLDDKGNFSLDDSVRLFYVKFILDDFDFGLEIKSPLSRHAIAHGGDTKFGYELNSIRCIALFDYLIDRCESGEDE